jgi:hypothetical protein
MGVDFSSRTMALFTQDGAFAGIGASERRSAAG